MAPDYCPICLRTFGVLIRPHVERAYTITPLGRAVLAQMRAGDLRRAS
jgi:hypothetical protein